MIAQTKGFERAQAVSERSAKDALARKMFF